MNLTRIEINLSTGEETVIPLTPQEIEAAQVQAAAEAARAPLREIAQLELDNPITHRGQREKALTDDAIQRALRAKINALDAEIAALAQRASNPLPEIPMSYGIQVVKDVDDAIKIERAKLP